MKEFLDIKYSTGAENLVDLFLPDENCCDLLIWFHGGGLEEGSRKSCSFHRGLVDKGVAIASVEYCMYPNAVFPQFIEDCANAVSFIIAHISDYCDVKRIFLSGQSAGAYITLMLAFDQTFLAAAGVDRTTITGYISDSGQIMTHFNVLRERGLNSALERIDDAAPIYHLSEKSDFKNLLLICYDEDLPCRMEENHLFYKYVQRLCPDQNVQLVQLPGGHCNGSLKPNDRGSYDFCDTLLEFIASID